MRTRKKHTTLSKMTGKTKIVRIDSKTQIEVDESISNADAIERYYLWHREFKIPASIAVKPLLPRECYLKGEELPAIIEEIPSENINIEEE